MRPRPRLLLVALACLGMASISYGQLFPNAPWNRRAAPQMQSQSSCPGGVCPTNRAVYQPVRTVIQQAATSRHWTYPGPSIASHLADAEHAAQLRAKGISTAGMSQEQMLSLHDALHENRVVVPQKVKTVAPQVMPRVAQPMIAVPQATAKPLPASESTFGLSEFSAPSTSASVPKFVLAQVQEQPKREVSSEFKSSLIKAIAEARKSNKITLRDSVRLRIACISPAFVERAQDLAVTQLALNAEASEHVPISDDGVIQVEGINWEGLAKFMEVFVPLLITLLKAFGL